MLIVDPEKTITTNRRSNGKTGSGGSRDETLWLGKQQGNKNWLAGAKRRCV